MLLLILFARESVLTYIVGFTNKAYVINIHYTV